MAILLESYQFKDGTVARRCKGHNGEYYEFLNPDFSVRSLITKEHFLALVEYHFREQRPVSRKRLKRHMFSIFEQVDPVPLPGQRFRILELVQTSDGLRTRIVTQSFRTLAEAQEFVKRTKED